MTIGEVARRAGIATSAIRYYERTGLLPKPARESGRRRYSPGILDRLAVIAFAQASGFTLREIRDLLASDRPYSERLRERAKQKVVEIDQVIERAKTMKSLLHLALRCNCMSLEQCGKRVNALSRSSTLAPIERRRSR